MHRTLTAPQQLALDFLIMVQPSGQTQRELATAAGFDHHQKFAVAIMGLYMKGYLVVDPNYLDELANAQLDLE
jgi:hypothetical protein